MIQYEAGTWALGFMFSTHGSVVPKALVWAFPNAILAFLVGRYSHLAGPLKLDLEMDGVIAIWGSYTFILGFLMVFRNSQAHIRFWEGTTAIYQVRTFWLASAGSIIAFCNREPEKQEEVRRFQHLYLRLLSMLFCSSLQRISEIQDDSMEILDPRGIDSQKMKVIQEASADSRPDIILQWLNRMMIDGEKNGVLKVAPPVLGRAFQELTTGHNWFESMKTISDIPFPFPYAQMITCMMLIHWFMTPLLAGSMMESEYWAAAMVFFVVGSLWCLIYIPMQLDCPFGTEDNDLPIKSMQASFNRELISLLNPHAQCAPAFKCPEGSPEMFVSWTSKLPC